MKQTIADDALKYAGKMHKGQRRRFTGESYIVHPMRVAAYLVTFELGTDMTRAKAFLHDVVEDTKATFDDIHDLFGIEVANSVYRLTDPNEYDKMKGMTKLEKLERYGEHIALGTSTDANIKLADILDNVPSMVHHAKHQKGLSYVREKKFFLQYLTKGDAVLYNYVKNMLQEQEALLIAL